MVAISLPSSAGHSICFHNNFSIERRRHETMVLLSAVYGIAFDAYPDQFSNDTDCSHHANTDVTDIGVICFLNSSTPAKPKLLSDSPVSQPSCLNHNSSLYRSGNSRCRNQRRKGLPTTPDPTLA